MSSTRSPTCTTSLQRYGGGFQSVRFNALCCLRQVDLASVCKESATGGAHGYILLLPGAPRPLLRTLSATAHRNDNVDVAKWFAAQSLRHIVYSSPPFFPNHASRRVYVALHVEP